MTERSTARWDGTMLSHRGCVRDSNEDGVAYLLPRRSDAAARLDLLAVVADGMGGHAAGEIASDLAVTRIVAAVLGSAQPLPEAIRDAIADANAAIHAEAQANAERAGMGTTCTLVAIADGELHLGHVGDSRAYVVRAGRAQQVSEDHSMVAELVRDGALSEAEARVHPERNIITRALGLHPTVEPQVFAQGLKLLPDDVVVLCSDGLTDQVTPDAIAAAAAAPPAEACERLLQQALAAGGHDNISVGVFALVAPPDDSRPPRSTGSLAVEPEDVDPA
jgi:serine/threonine protein phosphatase PrpC